MYKRILRFVAVVMAVLVLAACGGGGRYGLDGVWQADGVAGLVVIEGNRFTGAGTDFTFNITGETMVATFSDGFGGGHVEIFPFSRINRNTFQLEWDVFTRVD